MKKNVASQIIGAQLNAKTDGSAVTTGTTTVYVTGDGGTQAAGSVGSGACTHEGQGFWTYAPAQAETNYDHVAFTFVNTSAVAATVQLYPSFPQTGDNFARLGAPAGASVSADVAAIKAETASILTDTAEIGAAGAGLTVLATQASVNTIDDFLDTEIAAILADTNELQTDWANGGRLDLILDARASQTTADAIEADTQDIQSRLPAALVGGRIDANAGAISGDSVAADNAESFFDGTGYAGTNNVIPSVTTVTGNVNGSVGSVTGAVGSVTGAVGSVTGNVGGNVTGSVGSVATGGIAAASFAAGAIDAAAIAADAIDASALATDAVTEIQSGLATAAALATVDTVVDAIQVVTDKLHTTLEAQGASSPGEYQFSASALELAPTGGSAPTVGQIADAVWDEAIAGHAISGSTGEALAAAGGAGDPWITNLPGSYTAGQAGYIVGAINVVTEKLHTTLQAQGASSPGEYQFSASALELSPTGGSAPTVGEIADAVWDELLSGHVISGSAGDALTDAGSMTGDVTAILADTNELQTDWVNGGRLDLILDARASQTSVDDLPTNAEFDARTLVAASYATAANLATVDTVVDAILVDTAEIGAAGAGLTALATQASVNTVDTVADAIKLVTDKLHTTLQAQGASSPGEFQFSASALELGPSGSITAPTAAEIADAVWDENLAAHAIAGSTGEGLADAGAAGNPWNSVLEGSLTAEDMLRICTAVAAGKTSIVTTSTGATVVFRDASDASNIVSADMAGSERTSVTLTP